VNALWWWNEETGNRAVCVGNRLRVESVAGPLEHRKQNHVPFSNAGFAQSGNLILPEVHVACSLFRTAGGSTRALL
jgi:hypothetical protein